MGIKVVGAGLGRTGTHSLKLALERLLGGPCYHMMELFPRPEHVALWHAAIKGGQPAWDTLLEGFVATVDWPAAAMWRELHGAFPDAVVLLSTRDSPDQWWQSFSGTILEVMERGPTPETAAWHAMAEDLLERFTPSYRDRTAAIAAYEAHNEAVREAVAPQSLIDWKTGAGWAPICAGLRLPEPSEPFPHVNTTDEFRAMTGLSVAGEAP